MKAARGVVITAVALGILGAGLLVRFPTKADCTASGRVVDPTERHCVAADGYEQLREHVLFHTAQVVTVALGLAMLGLVVRWAARRRGARAREGAVGRGKAQ